MNILEVTGKTVEEKVEEIEKLIRNTEFFKYNKNNLRKAFVYHGTKANIHPYQKFEFKKRTGPRDTPKITHKMVAELSKERLGFSLREETVFCSKDYNLAKQFGIPYVIIPIGEYDAYFNEEIYDFTTFYNTHFIDFGVINIIRFFVSYIIEELPDDIMDKVKKAIIDELDEKSISSDRLVISNVIRLGRVRANVEHDLQNIENIGNLEDQIFDIVLKHTYNAFDELLGEKSSIEPYIDNSESVTHQYIEGKIDTTRQAFTRYVANVQSAKLFTKIIPQTEIMLKCKEFYLIDRELAEMAFENLAVHG